MTTGSNSQAGRTGGAALHAAGRVVWWDEQALYGGCDMCYYRGLGQHEVWSPLFVVVRTWFIDRQRAPLTPATWARWRGLVKDWTGEGCGSGKLLVAATDVMLFARPA